MAQPTNDEKNLYQIENYQPQMVNDAAHDANSQSIQAIIQKLNNALQDANNRLTKLGG
jgi:hypothetical protein